MLLDLHIGFSQETGKVLCYSNIYEFSAVCCDPHKGFSIVNQAEVDVSLEFSCFFYDPTDVGNLLGIKNEFFVVTKSSTTDFLGK